MSNWDTHEEQRDKRVKWVEDNQARMTELSEVVVSAMDEKTLIALTTDVVQSGWADYPEGFEYEWKQYQNGDRKTWY
jgi:hypothetical protein|tara:strand:- start:333 stop:563 length:231 start_codon:yes stop_codon:yes gene_type:complete